MKTTKKARRGRTLTEQAMRHADQFAKQALNSAYGKTSVASSRPVVREMDEGAFFKMRTRLKQQAEAIEAARAHMAKLENELAQLRAPVPMLLWCPECLERHVDEDEFATRSHHTHACQRCGMVWRPALVATVGVRFLPGFKNEEAGRG